MKRFPFLDWMRGLAVVVMIQCHTFNAWTRADLWSGGPYVLSQFVGGMAAPLFLFMAGITFAFQMDSLDRREPRPRMRWLGALRRGAYVLAIAFAFRLSNFLASQPNANMRELVKVDILNCMGVGMLAFSVAAMVDPRNRARYAATAALAIAAASPLVANLPWGGAPMLLRQYVAAEPGLGYFAFFPCAAYVGFGLAVGAVVKRTGEDRFERLMQWSLLIGLALVFCVQYFANLSVSIYPKSDFWANSPALILIRTGISLLLLCGAYLWTEFCGSPGWSWVETLGRNSLMVYWVHIMLVYGGVIPGLKGKLSIAQNAAATVALVVSMVALSLAWNWWKARRRSAVTAAAQTARG